MENTIVEASLAILPVTPEIADIAETYINRFVLPNDPGGDTVHLALASYHECDVLLTWNCQHLANFRKLDHIRRVNVLLDLHVPALLTPLELPGESELLCRKARLSPKFVAPATASRRSSATMCAACANTTWKRRKNRADS